MITKDNYEEYFLLYLDDELSSEDRKLVEEWVDQNPDMQEEWEAILACRIEPEEKLSFPDKTSLFRPVPSQADIITKENYTEFFCLYIDGELDQAGRLAVEAFIRSHPSTEVELQQLRTAIIKPDETIVYPDKASLYRPEKKRRIAILPWMAVGAAAAVLGVVALLLFNGPSSSFLASKDGAKQKTTSTPASGNVEKAIPSKESGADSNRIANADDHLSSEEKKRSFASDAVTKSQAGALQQKAGMRQLQSPVDAGALASTTKKAADNHPQSSGSTTGSDGNDNAIAQAQTPVKNDPAGASGGSKETGNGTLTTLAVLSHPANITKEQSSFATQALMREEGEEDDKGNAIEDDRASSGKNKLRGFFRKVTRTFTKTADRDKDGQRQVLVGAFQVAL